MAQWAQRTAENEEGFSVDVAALKIDEVRCSSLLIVACTCCFSCQALLMAAEAEHDRQMSMGGAQHQRQMQLFIEASPEEQHRKVGFKK